jgi:histidinol phosphatase-like PHP family hydrolase
MQAEGREWLNLFSKEMIAKFDYVLTDAMTFTDATGKRIRLWIKDEVEIKDKQDFMDMYVDKIVSVLNNEPIDIFANATFLPACIADEYDRLWTQERMDKVIKAAVKNDVAIEINATFGIPSPTFIKRAKQVRAKFSFGTNNGGRELGHLAYCRRMATECGLIEEDMFTPRPDGRKPVQRWKPAY